MSQEENPGQEHASAQQPVADTSANEVRTPAPSIREAKLESAHAELPPMSVIGATNEPSAAPGSILPPKQFGRRGTPRGGAPTAPGQAARPTIGVVENPAELTESLSGDRAKQGGERRERREPRAPREPRPASAEGAPSAEGRQPGIPSDGAAFEGRPRSEPRERREPREPRQEGAPQGERPRREDRPRREERPRIQIDPVVIPVQAPIGFWATLKRKLASWFGIPDKAVFVPTGHPYNQRGEHRGEHRGERRDRGHRGGRGRGGDRGHRGERRDRGGDRGHRHGPREG